MLHMSDPIDNALDTLLGGDVGSQRNQLAGNVLAMSLLGLL